MRLTAPTAGMITEDPAFACATCGDRGWRMISHGEEQRMTRCECQSPRNNKALVRQLMKAAGMRADEITSAYRIWDLSHQPRPLFARTWLEEGLAGEGALVINPWCLTLLGKTGRGKTMTAAVLVRIYIESGGKTPLWVRVPEGFDRVQAERRTDAYLEGGALETRIRRAELCVFDDFGIVHRANSDTMEATVNEWLAVRQRRHALSVITCNAVNLEDLGAPRVESRLAEGVYRLLEAETDYRDKEAR